MLHFCTMTQASILCAVVLCVWISVVTAADGPGYIKVADFATKEATTNIVSLGAVLHVALNDDSVPNIDNHDDHTEWTHGKTKLDVTIEWSKGSEDIWKQSFLVFSTLKCWEDDFAGSSNIYDGTGGAWRWTLGQQSPEETVGESGGTKLTFSLVQDLVISIPKAPCMYVTRDSKVLAKVDVVPARPTFPETFYSGIESTHVKKGYTRYGSEAYSHLCDAVSFAFYNSEVGFKRVVGDYKNQKVWHITSPNETFPNGVCWSETMSNRPEFIEGENGGLVSSAKFLGFINNADTEAEYVPDGQTKIRGVPTDQWKYSTLRTPPGSDVEERLTVHLYFSSPEWHFSKSTGYRILQRVEITGHDDNTVTNTSTQVDNSYDYIDFRTFLPPMAGFEPCEIMPGGDGCECLNLGCTDEEASGRGVVTQFASPAACGALGYGEGGGGGRTEGFFGIFVGAALAAGVAYLARRYMLWKAGREEKETEIVEQPQVVMGAFAPSTESRASLPYMEPQVPRGPYV